MDQLNIFDMLFPKYKMLKPIRLIECFAGIGSQGKSLKRLQKEFGFKFEHYRVIEFDKYAIASYNAIHNTSFETSDITKVHAYDLGIVETNKYDYIMTYSFPCQDLSLAGKRRGMDKNSGTRSGLLWEVERILDEIVSNNGELPQILLMENVPQVISSQNMDNFHLWQKKLEDLGYSNYVSLLNAKDYGIPQNRNRCFMISILGQYNYSFPKQFELKLKLKDMLEDVVDEKYYLSSKQINYMETTSYIQSSYDRVVQDVGNICDTLCARDYKGQKCVEVFDYRYDEGIRGRTEKDICPTITCKAGTAGIPGQPLLNITLGGVMIPEATKKGYAIARYGDGINLSYLSSKSRRGRVAKQSMHTITCNSDSNGVVIDSKLKVIGQVSSPGSQSGKVYSEDGLFPTLCAGTHGYAMGNVEHNLRIRKLTPLECWRLMGFDDEDFYKAAKVNSNTQLYKQAGNSIVVDVLYYIFKEFFI